MTTSDLRPRGGPAPAVSSRPAGLGCALAILVTCLAPTGPAAAGAADARPQAQEVALLTGPAAIVPPIPRRRSARPPTLEELAQRTALRHGLNPELVHAVILTESLYAPKALSHKGAMGLMQLMPGTARRYGVADPWDPAQNIDGGVRYLRDLMGLFDKLPLVLAAYNAGEEAVIAYGRKIPPYAETELYVERAQRFLAKLEAGGSVARLKESGSGLSARFSGWGVIFGSFHDRGEARRVIKANWRVLRGIAAGARGAIVRRNREAGLQYSALLVGLKEQQAGAACKRLWQEGAYCRALMPAELRDSKAVWR